MKAKSMKNHIRLRIQFFLLIGFIFPFIVVSCASTPGSQTTALAGSLNTPADKTSLEDISQARAMAEEARSRAEYVNGSTYCLDEWGLAENRYLTAKDYDIPKTKGETNVQVAEWKALNTVYEDIYNRSFPQYAGEQQKLLATAREEAVKAGADKLVPERFAQADALAGIAGEKFEKGDLDGSIRDGKQARDRYRVLQIIAEAHNIQAEADKNDFFSVDPDSYILAADAGNQAVDLYDESKLPEARDVAEDAVDRFSQVVKNGWVSKIEEKTSFAEEARIVSRRAKADIASKPEFDAAEQVYNRALAAQNAEDYAKAAELFNESGGLFIKARDSAVIKRERAEEALLKAEQKLAESEEKAQTAEDLIGGE
jgi:hypothetical protein